MSDTKTTRLFSPAERKASGEALFACVKAWRTNQDDPDDNALCKAMELQGMDFLNNEHLLMFFLHAGDAKGAPPEFARLRKFVTDAGLDVELGGKHVVVWK